MGKSQKQKKRSAKRHNPVRVPDSHLPKGLEAAAASSSRKDAVLPIIQKVCILLSLGYFFVFEQLSSSKAPITKKDYGHALLCRTSYKTIHRPGVFYKGRI